MRCSPPCSPNEPVLLASPPCFTCEDGAATQEISFTYEQPTSPDFTAIIEYETGPSGTYTVDCGVGTPFGSGTYNETQSMAGCTYSGPGTYSVTVTPPENDDGWVATTQEVTVT